MSTFKLLIVGFIYAWVTIDFLAAGKIGFALMFFGYALGIIGTILAARGI